MSEHTKGPWKSTTGDIGDEDVVIVPAQIISATGVVVVDTEGGLFSWRGEKIHVVEREANARLIASSPDLLEACRNAHSALSQYRVDLMGCESYIPNLGGLIVNLERVIAKAKGQAP